MVRHRLNDQQWELVQDLFPPPSRTGRPRRDRREILDGVLWVLRTGAPWRDLATELGPWANVWDLFDTRNGDGTLDAILSRLRSAAIDAGLVDRESWCIDGTVIRAARCAGGGGKGEDPEEPADHALGRSQGGFSTKIHQLCDGHGHPLDFHLTPGQAHETTGLVPPLEGAEERVVDGDGEPIAWPVALAGDKGYRADWIDEYLIEMGTTPVIPSKEGEDRSARPVEFDKDAYRRRSIVENLIGRLKECRRVFSRFEKTAKNFGGMIKMAFIQRYLRLCSG
ncbi:IS5 family transposase [Isosphaeraceae bacterium EP7]